MFEIEVFVIEFISVDGFATSTIVIGKISTLDHEIFDQPVEN
jgi:hypothetical protein